MRDSDMTAAQAEARATTAHGEPTYRWSDLRAHRSALGLRREEIVALLGINGHKYWERETGSRPVGADLMPAVLGMERFIQRITLQEIAAIEADPPARGGTVVLEVFGDQAEFDRSYPDAQAEFGGVRYPLLFQQVAIGRASAELTRRGYVVEVYRGDLRVDLAVRRLAAGLLKGETIALLGVDRKRYYRWEAGTNPPPAGLIAELQAVDDFIDEAAADLRVETVGGLSVVMTVEDDEVFKQMYPRACTTRGGNRYPLRVLRLAAVRRASAIRSSGGDARIVVTGDIV